MSPLYHLQVGSFIAAGAFPGQRRERRLVMLASLAPDLDGAFFFSPALWERLHHTFGHNIWYALLIGAVMGGLARGRRAFVAGLCAATALLQVALDQVTNDPTWRIPYLWPVSKMDFALSNYISWPGLAFFQVWVVQGILMVLILAGTVMLYRRTGRTFLELFSANLDRLLTDFLVLPFTARCRVCGSRASYRLADSGEAVCGRHGRVHGNFTVTPRPEAA